MVIENIQSLVKKFKGNNNSILWIVFVLIVFLFIVLRPQSGSFPKVDSSTYQAVFLTNNQVYFGKLNNFSSEYIILNDIYYLQISEPLQQGSGIKPEDIPNINLAKLGNEIHGPEDKMFIPKERILFWENLKTDSLVVRAISAQGG